VYIFSFATITQAHISLNFCSFISLYISLNTLEYLLKASATTATLQGHNTLNMEPAAHHPDGASWEHLTDVERTCLGVAFTR
jgi:hypothetical protein